VEEAEISRMRSQPAAMRRLRPTTVFYGLEFFLRWPTWVVMAVYLVQERHLSPLQLVLMGTAMEAAVFLFEIPTGVVADLYSRRLSVVIGVTLGTISGSTTLTVTAPTLNSIVLTPDQTSVPLGISQPFVATGNFSDGSSQMLTSVTWGSSDTAIAPIDNAGTATTLNSTGAFVTGRV
jgi:MFS family permease